MSISFRCVGLCKSFGSICALSDFTVEFPSSGITAIVGPNGAGKTTLLDILTGFLKPDRGRCFLRNLETTNLAPHRISQLGVARSFQSLRVVSHESVLDNVLLACRAPRGESVLGALFRVGVAAEDANNREAARRHLGFVGLRDYASSSAGTLSYGQQKLLALACCLATDARILLLDEPLSGIHQETVSSILGLFRGLRNEGRVIVFIEHDIGAVRAVADHVVFMDQGRLTAEGTPHEVLERREVMEAYIG